MRAAKMVTGFRTEQGSGEAKVGTFEQAKFNGFLLLPNIDRPRNMHQILVGKLLL